ncbi:double-strand break repair protein AddB [Rhodobacteraceae bacterium RKSG542]|uniref:double-strand break repair protein AddB n=1 Tax=Pseudovibrio flavus TaxID=2529854 RepID=UPI0012BC0432|nr:double-strand break repair protein AddB [Pseudovibrio flavus]MTI17802.1 double-strand break repair protein AddB [Pseudovibrio flavus]
MQDLRVFSIGPNVPFLPVLVDNLLSGNLVAGSFGLENPLALADVTIYVPTRRAARTLPDILRAQMGARATLLPKILPLGDVDEDEHIVSAKPDGLALPPALSLMERRLAMTRLVWAWKGHLRQNLLDPDKVDISAIPASAADAAWLAGDLITLMDEVQTEEADWKELESLAPDNHAQYWQVTLEFLKIVTEQWPAFLTQLGVMDPKARRSALIRREAERLRQMKPRGPVIVAGATGSVPATTELLKAVLELEQGAIVLPGLDRQMDDVAWHALGQKSSDTQIAGHPQHSLYKLLTNVNVRREDVVELGECKNEALVARSRIINEALRPAETTDAWQAYFNSALKEQREEAFADVKLVQAKSDAEEALALALCLREAIEDDKKVALITPDRKLSRRVASELTRWGIIVDDTAGRPLEHTPPTVLALLAAKLALSGLEPVDLLALLKHPLTRFGLSLKQVRAAARSLERGVLRGPRARAGISGLKEAVAAARATAETKHTPRWKKLVEADWLAVDDLLERLEQALAPLEELLTIHGEIPIAQLVNAHTECLMRITAEEEGGNAEYFRGENGEALAQVLTELIDANETGLCIPALEWPAVFAALISGSAVRPRKPADPRIHLLGPMEARLQHYDRVILSGLNEGTWPQRTRNSPWLNRPMKTQIGLEPPERRVGSAAHDFLSMTGMPEVILSRSERVDGSPTVASRWLQRILTLAGPDVAKRMRHDGNYYTELANALDRMETAVRPAKRPEPKPPLAARPRQLSVTAIETLIRDPYAIYARRVLNLDEVEPIGGEPGVADKGTIIHDALANFLENWTGPFDETAERALLEEGGRLFRPLDAFPEIRALWWPRFERIAKEFIAFERRYQDQIAERFLEVAGGAEMKRPDYSFRLTGRADRIDAMKDGTLRVIDYKTGMPPSLAQVESLLSPQLPLEVAMIRRAGFENVPPEDPVSELLYVQLSGGRKALVEHSREPKDHDIADLGEEAWNRLEKLVAAYENPEKGYLSRARVLKERQWHEPYDHLARVQEWSLGGEGDDD